MKEIQFTQTYELTVTVNMEVADDWTPDDIEGTATDFPISVDVTDHFDSYEYLYKDEEVIPKVVGLCVDGLVTIGYPEFHKPNGVTETEQ